MGRPTAPSPDTAAAGWVGLLDELERELTERAQLLELHSAAGSGARAGTPEEIVELPNDPGPFPLELLERARGLLDAITDQEAAFERDLTAVSHELARIAVTRPSPTSRSVDGAGSGGFEARA